MLPDLGPKYQVLGELGAGAMGRVYKARQIMVGRTVAVKVVSAALVDSDESRRRFFREIKLTGRLNHQHIVQLHDAESVVTEELQTVFIVSEYIDGTTLKAYLADNPMPPFAETVRMVRELCLGLAHAHGLGIVHRDIKPENILLTKAGQVKIADFGLAKSVAGEGKGTGTVGTTGQVVVAAGATGGTITGEGTLLGTPLFMAPEQIRGEPVTAATDLYAVGMMLYCMLTGRHPFRAGDVATMLQKQLNEKPPRPAMVNPEVPPALAALAMELLAKDPARRPSSAEAVIERLEQFPRRDLGASSGRTATSTATVAPGATETAEASVAAASGKATTTSGVRRRAGGRQGRTRSSSAALPSVAVASGEGEGSSARVRWLAVAVLAVLAVVGGVLSWWPGEPFAAIEVAVERLSPRQVRLRWDSGRAYRARFVALPVGGTGKTVIEERGPTTSHLIEWDELRPSRDWHYRISAGEQTLTTGTLSGKPGTVEGLWFYPRRESADVDWQTAVPLENPKVIVEGRSYRATRVSTDADGRWRYSATVDIGDVETHSYRIADIAKAKAFSANCDHEIVARTPARLSMMERIRRAMLKRLSKRDFQRLAATLSPTRRAELEEREGDQYPRFAAPPYCVGDSMLCGHKAGELIVYARPTDAAFRLPRATVALQERWAFRDQAPNYGEVKNYFFHDGYVHAILNRCQTDATGRWWGYDSRAVAPVLDAALGKARDELFGGKTIAAADRVVVLNEAGRRARWQKLVQTSSRDAVLNDTEYRQISVALEERSFPLQIPPKPGLAALPVLNSGIDWAFDRATGSVIARVYRAGPRDQIVQMKMADPAVQQFSVRLEHARSFVQPPIRYGEAFYALCSPNQNSKMEEILAEKATTQFFCFDMQSGRHWHFDVPAASCILSRIAYDEASERCAFSTARALFVLDLRERLRLLRLGKPVPKGLMEDNPREYTIGLSRVRQLVEASKTIPREYGHCFTMTPVLFGSAKSRAAGREYLLVSLHAKKGSFTSPAFGKPLHVRGYVVISVEQGQGATALLEESALGMKPRQRIVNRVSYAGRCEHLVEYDEQTGLIGFVQMGQVVVVDPLADPPKHIVLSTRVEGKEMDRLRLDGNAVYYTVGEGTMYRIGFSPTRLRRYRRR